MELKYINNENKYKTVKEVLKKYFHISDRLLLKLKNNNKIFLNNQETRTSTQLLLNDTVTVDISFIEKSENINPVKMDLDIIYEDNCMLIVNKPFGLTVHPSMAHFEDSLSNGLQYYFEQNNIQTKIRPVNRLDKDTSGIVIFAKNEHIQNRLTDQMKNHIFKKSYIAILEGNLEKTLDTINAPIARKPGSIIERQVNSKGQKAITHYKLIKNYIDFCLVEFELETGRTHQIRVHSKYIGHPILGDTLYGNSSELISRQALHAYKVEFIHPIKKEQLTFQIDLPSDFKKIL